MAQEVRICLRATLPFDLSTVTAAGVIEALRKTKGDIEKRYGISLDLDHAVVRPRALKATKTEVAVVTDSQLDVATHAEGRTMGKPTFIAEPTAEAPLVFAPGREPATAGESADALLNGPSFKQLAEAAKAKREAEKTGVSA